MSFNLPFGIYVANPIHLDEKYEVANETEMFNLVTNGLVRNGHAVYRSDVNQHFVLLGSTNSDWAITVDFDTLNSLLQLSSLNTTEQTNVAGAINEVLSLVQGIATSSSGLFDFDASGGLLPASGSGPSNAIAEGDRYYVSVAGTIAGLTPISSLTPGDLLIARIDNAVNPADFIVIQGNISKATLSDAQAAIDDAKYMTALMTREQIRVLFSDGLINLLNQVTNAGSGQIITDTERSKLSIALTSQQINTLSKLNSFVSDATILSQDEIEAITGFLNALTTTNKTNLVSAINEVKAIADGAGGQSGSTFIAPPQYFLTTGTQSQFTVTPTIGTAGIYLVEVNGDVQKRGENYTVNGNAIEFSENLPANMEVGVYFFETFSTLSGNEIVQIINTTLGQQYWQEGGAGSIDHDNTNNISGDGPEFNHLNDDQLSDVRDLGLVSSLNVIEFVNTGSSLRSRLRAPLSIRSFSVTSAGVDYNMAVFSETIYRLNLTVSINNVVISANAAMPFYSDFFLEIVQDATGGRTITGFGITGGTLFTTGDLSINTAPNAKSIFKVLRDSDSNIYLERIKL